MNKTLLLFTPFFFLNITTIVSGADTPDEMKIREVRAVSNKAILERDVKTLKQTWLPELTVTGSNGRIVRDGEEMAQIFSSLFKNPEFDTYVRTPGSVRLSPGGSLAAESGEWSAHWRKSDGEMTVRGIYLAQWLKRGEPWLIRSEVFIAHACSGSSACDELP